MEALHQTELNSPFAHVLVACFTGTATNTVPTTMASRPAAARCSMRPRVFPPDNMERW